MNIFKHITYTLIFLSIILLVACQKNKDTELKPLNLMSYGYPITIMAPDSAKVRESLSSVISEVTITGKGGYDLLVQSSEITFSSSDPKEIKDREKKLVESSKYFSEVVKEEDHGFIYKIEIDSTIQRYDFVHVKVKGNKEFLFKGPYSNELNLKQAEWLYGIVSEDK